MLILDTTYIFYCQHISCYDSTRTISAVLTENLEGAIMNVLIVDDEADSLRPLFARLPATIHWAATRTEMERELAANEFDTIMMDGSLVGWGARLGEPGYGSNVVRELRARGVTTKIVMFSGLDEWNEDGLAAGANSVWSKKRRYEDPNWRDTLLAALA